MKIKSKERKDNKAKVDAFSKLKSTNDKRARNRRIFYTVLISALSLIFIILCIAVFFRVKSVSVVSSGLYPDADIIAASGIKENEHILGVRESEVASNILSSFSYVRSVSLKRNLPTNIELTLTCDEPNYYIEIDGEFFIVSKDLRVLDRMWSKDEVRAKFPTIKKIGTGEVKSAIVGGYIEFVNPLYEEDTKELISYVEKCSVFENITSFDITDRYDIKVVYDSHLQASCGDIKEMDIKLKFFGEIAKDLGKAGGTVDIKDVNTGYALVNNNLIFD